MKNKYNTLTCLFGHHDYSDKETRDKYGRDIYLCKICKRSGYGKWNRGPERWLDYDEEGNLVHEKWGHGLEYWYDHNDDGSCVHERWDDGTEYWFNEDGDIIHTKDPDGNEAWRTNNGHWINKKPEEGDNGKD